MNTQGEQYPNLGLVVAMGNNREIGYQNNLIWRIKEDLAFFKNVTMNSYIVMGRKTYDSMPKNLVGRRYVVLSRDQNFNLETPKIVHHNVDDTLSLVLNEKDSKFWVVGGGFIYKEFLPYVSTMHITQIDDCFPQADTYFPEFDPNEWQQEESDLKCSEERIEYKHTLLLRRHNNKF